MNRRVTSVIVAVGIVSSLLSGVTGQGTASADAGGAEKISAPAVPRAAPELAQPGEPGKLIVSLTFDDGYDNQLGAAETMNEYGLNGTFYVNSARLGTARRLTWAELDRIRDMGNEIGGHTAWHASLPSVNHDEQLREVCDDRVKLTEKGFDVANFAYPYGAHDDASAESVAACGYNSARVVGGLASESCPGCQAAGPLVPADAFAIPALSSVVDDSDPKIMIEEILAAQRHGGWAIMVFHDVCDGCSTMGFTPEKFRTVVKWLQEHESAGIEVRTVQEQLGMPTQPTVAAPAPSRVEAKLSNGDLSNVVDVSGEDGVPPGPLPVCWEKGGFGENTATWSRKYDRALRAWTASVRLSDRKSGDAKLIVQMGSGGCAPAVVAGNNYQLRASYRSDVQAKFVVFTLDADGRWTYLGASPEFGPAENWTAAVWTTPAMPKTALRIAFGLSIADNGELTTGRYSIVKDSNPVAFPWVWFLGFVLVVGLLVSVLPAVGKARRRRG